MKRAILQLQRALRRRFGKASGSGVGAATLSIAHDRIEMTNEGCVIEARGGAQVARVLRRKRKSKGHNRK
jgi:hypothetical protein